MSTFIKVTITGNRTTVYIRAADIRTIEKNPQNPLATIISTNLITSRGPALYEVMESQEEVMRQVDIALDGGPKISLN